MRWMSAERSKRALIALVVCLGIGMSACGDADEQIAAPGGDRDPATAPRNASPISEQTYADQASPPAVLETAADQNASRTSDAAMDSETTAFAMGSPVANLNACGMTDGEPLEHSTDPNALLLRIEQSFPAPPMSIFEYLDLPDVSLYGDGRLIVSQPGARLYDNPSETNLTESGVQSLLHAASTAGMLEGDALYVASEYRGQSFVDFIMNAGGTTSTVRVTDLAQTDFPGNVTDAEIDARIRLRYFLECALSARDWLSEDAISTPTHEYLAERYQIGIQLGGPPNPVVTPNARGEIVEPPVREWPFATPAQELGVPYLDSSAEYQRCVILECSELATMLELIDDQLRETRWLSDGEYY